MSVSLLALDGKYAICRLPPDHRIPDWAQLGPLFCVARTAEELSILCAEENLPESVQGERGWRAFRVQGRLEFSEIGILSALAAPLAAAEISILAFSTFDTDYVLVRREQWQAAVATLEAAGHRFLGSAQEV